jgi:hypothetical protein
MAMAELSVEQRCFRLEADMLAPLSVAAKQLIGRHAYIVYEVPAAVGVPDVVVASVDVVALLERAGKDFLINPTELAVVLYLSNRFVLHEAGVTSGQIADAVGVTRRHLHSSVLPSLRERHHVRSDGTYWYPDVPYRPLATRLITIEAKLHDWKKGLAQAARQVPGSDESWLVLDYARREPAVRRLDLFELYSVGLATIDPAGELLILQPPPNSPLHVRSLRRELLAERVASFIAGGTTSGPVPSVFGTVSAASTGCDPRLQGVGAR